MKLPIPVRTALPAAMALAAMLLGGCWADRIDWSPDGSRAAVITDDGLYLSDADGHLSPLLVPGACLAAWLADSQRIVVARQEPLADWAAVSAAVGPERAADIAAEAEKFWSELQAGRQLDNDRDQAELGVDEAAVLIFLREHHEEGVRRIAGVNWEALRKASASLYTIRLGRVEGDRIDLGVTYYKELAPVADLRPAPSSRALAFTIGSDPRAEANFALLAAPMDAATPAAVVARDVAAYADWTPDSLTLAYLQATDAAGTGDLRLGTLSERGVVVAGDQVRLDKKILNEASLVFHSHDRVRCLKDGRVLFSGAAFSFPAAGDDFSPPAQLYAFAPGKHPSVTGLLSPAERDSLHAGLLFFAVSPDEKQALLGKDDGSIWLLDLANGGTEVVQPHDQTLSSQSQLALPAWRRPGEFSYIKPFAHSKGAGRQKAPNAELVLRGPGGETILSRDWTDATMKRFFSQN